MNLTKRQQEVYAFISGYFDDHGTAPSYEEIADALGLRSLSTVHKHIGHLARKGFIDTPWASQKRALTLIERGARSVGLPLLGTVAAGKPIEAIELPDHVDVPPSLLRGGECFALKVRGDSMIGEGIHDGDTILVKKQPNAEPGQTVVALIDGEATVKKFYPRGKKIELWPANPDMEPIVADPESVTLQGIVIGLIRSY